MADSFKPDAAADSFKPDAAQPQGLMGHVANFAKNFWQDLATSGQGMVNMVAHPIDTVRNIGAGQDALRLKAEDALKRGDYVEAARHALSYAVPVAGPAIDARGDQAQRGDVSGAMGGATSLGLQLAGPEALARTVPVPAVGAPAPRVSPDVKQTLNPVERGAVDFLKNRDVPLTPGTITGNKFVKALQATTQNSPLGATTAADFTRGTEAGIRRVAGDLANDAHPQPVTAESVGEAIPNRLKKNIADRGVERDTAYQDAWQGRGEPDFTETVPVQTRQVAEIGSDGKPTGKLTQQPVMAKVNMPVDVRDIKSQAGPIFEEMQWMPAADRASNAGYRAVEKILEGDDFIPAWQAETGLGGLKTMARLANKSGVRDSAQGIAASIIPDLQNSIDAAVAKTGDTALSGLRRGRETHAKIMEIADLADKLREEPVQTFNQMTWQNDTGVKFLRQIQEQAPEQMPQIGRAFVQQMFDKASREGGFTKTRSLLDRWNDLGPETKKILFPDSELRDNLGKFFKGADMVAQNPNPSGTALVQAAQSVNPVRWAAGYLGSKLFFTPRGIAMLTEGMQPRSAGAAALNAAKVRAMAARETSAAATLSRAAGQEEEE